MPLDPTAAVPPPVLTLDEAGITALARDLIERRKDPARRAILAIAGIPGSGKSTLANAVTDIINRLKPGSALLCAMDGFHMTNDKLERLGLRYRKGAPQTFEAQRYLKLLTQLRDTKLTPAVPVFDREIDEPVYTGRPEHTANASTHYIITEGNYLLLDTLPWTEIDAIADLRVLVDTPIEQARRWVIERHMAFGRSREQAEAWYESNDLLNVKTIHAQGRHADRIARWP